MITPLEKRSFREKEKSSETHSLCVSYRTRLCYLWRLRNRKKASCQTAIVDRGARKLTGIEICGIKKKESEHCFCCSVARIPELISNYAVRNSVAQTERPFDGRALNSTAAAQLQRKPPLCCLSYKFRSTVFSYFHCRLGRVFATCALTWTIAIARQC